MSVLEDLTTTKENYAAELAADSANPQPDYSLDGESVSREAWRNGLMERIAKLNALIALENPFELRSYSI